MILIFPFERPVYVFHVSLGVLLQILFRKCLGVALSGIFDLIVLGVRRVDVRHQRRVLWVHVIGSFVEVEVRAVLVVVVPGMLHFERGVWIRLGDLREDRGDAFDFLGLRRFAPSIRHLVRLYIGRTPFALETGPIALTPEAGPVNARRVVDPLCSGFGILPFATDRCELNSHQLPLLDHFINDVFAPVAVVVGFPIPLPGSFFG